MTADRKGTTDSEGVRSSLCLVAPIALAIVAAPNRGASKRLSSTRLQSPNGV